MSQPRSHYKYKVGDEAQSSDLLTCHSNNGEAVLNAFTLQKGDGAFILRHDRTWRYAIVAEVSLSPDPFLIFIVDPDGCSKRVDKCHWGDRVRPFKPKHTKPVLEKVVNPFSSKLNSRHAKYRKTAAGH